jgi:outer membrane protein OmpA-like peptidoglycan-associated protein
MPRILFALSILTATSTAFAEATIPKADKPGSKDHPLELVPDRKDAQNNRYHEPKQKKPLEGAYTRLVYLIPANRSPLEVLRNYQQEVTQKGGRILFECKAAECGGNATGSSGGGGGNMSLSMFLFPGDRVKEPSFSNGKCAMTEPIDDQRYAAAELPAQSVHLSILTYMLKGGRYCEALDGRTIAVIDIIEGKAREQKMVTVTSGEMAKEISSRGSVALYGIYFDFNKADLKPESDPALAEIAKLLKENAALKLLVVGHTDNVGTLPFNMDLSQRRAASVVSALVAKIDKTRLTPLGVAYASPVAPNKSEEGRAKNRRVELVEH